MVRVMTRLAWLTDVHFDLLKPEKPFKFGKMVARNGDYCVITGDIAHGDTVCEYLEEFQRGFGGKVYFVLGNHDIWKSSFEQVHKNIRELCSDHENLHWLGDGVVHYINGVQLCGVDGWYDCQAGLTTDRIRFAMNDWHQIEELKANFNVHVMGFSDPLINQLRNLGQSSAHEARQVLAKCHKDKHVIFATHVPPYEESSFHEGGKSDATHLPFYTNIALGYVLKDWAYSNRDLIYDKHRKLFALTTLCGHTHSPGEFIQRANHKVYTGKSLYGNPQISKVFDL